MAGRMKKKHHYTITRFDVNRRMVAASAAISKQTDTIYLMTEVDVSKPRKNIDEHRKDTGERLSLTGYIVSTLAQTIAEFPEFNARRRGGKLYLLDDVTIGVLVEREISGKRVPEPMSIYAADRKSLQVIHREIRAAQSVEAERLGGLSGAGWVRFIPSFLFKLMIKIASKSVSMAVKYGVVAVTSVGMFVSGAVWPIPLSSATVAVAVGGIVERLVVAEGLLESREHLCLTIAFDHDIVDGAPAARFVGRLSELLSAGDKILEG
jgi:pyruvate/2-oxoglutarate dehydrogenase complex dihydrolipoamide acyltransferase (E2) component